MILALLPVYLGTVMGVSAATIGLIEGLALVASGALGGLVSDV